MDGHPRGLGFAAYSQRRAIAKVLAQADKAGKFGCDAAAAWTEVVNLGRFDLQ